jgi:predicted AlkP superfamily phosphohydrolase/phosphomutase
MPKEKQDAHGSSRQSDETWNRRKRTLALELLLIGWDGATFSLLDPLVDKGVMPNLEEALRRGVRSNLLSIVPPLTPPAWTSMVTGVSPGNHGVFDFFQKEAPDALHLRLTLSNHIRAETLWTLANREGKKATVLNFPVTFPPPKIQGAIISGGWLTWRQLRLACYPQALYEEIRQLEGIDLKILASDMSHEAKAVEGCSPEETRTFVESQIQRETQWFKILAHRMVEHPTEVVSIVFDGADKVQHLCWPELSSWIQNRQGTGTAGPILKACLDYYREIDRSLGWLMRRMEADSHLLLVSDHGFGESRDIFFVNQWLHAQGLLHWREDQAPDATDRDDLGMARIARHSFEMDWDKTRAFAATPSSNGIHVLPMGPLDPQHAGFNEKRALEEEIITGLAEVRSPTTGRALVERVWRREEAFPGPHGALAPDLTLSLWDGGLVSILPSDRAVRTRPEPVGAHRPEGIFVGVGPGLLEGRQVAAMSILDVAPLAVHLLGLPVPAAMEGHPPLEALKPEFQAVSTEEVLEKGPPEKEPPRQTDPEEEVLTEEDEKAIAERLRQLGYLE